MKKYNLSNVCERGDRGRYFSAAHSGYLISINYPYMKKNDRLELFLVI